MAPLRPRRKANLTDCEDSTEGRHPLVGVFDRRAVGRLAAGWTAVALARGRSTPSPLANSARHALRLSWTIIHDRNDNSHAQWGREGPGRGHVGSRPSGALPRLAFPRQLPGFAFLSHPPTSPPPRASRRPQRGFAWPLAYRARAATPIASSVQQLSSHPCIDTMRAMMSRPAGGNN